MPALGLSEERARPRLDRGNVGALLSLRVATVFDAPLRSFVVDVAPIVHPGFEWSERVQELQTPGVGERFMTRTREADPEDPETTAARLAGAGVAIDLRATY